MDHTAQNRRIAYVGHRLITFQDLLVEWEVERLFSPALDAFPPESRQPELARAIVADWLWIDHARDFPAFTDWTAKELERVVRQEYAQVWGRIEREEHRNVLRRRVEAQVAQEASLQSDANFQRFLEPVPGQLRALYRENLDRLVEPAQVELAQVLVLKAIHGDQARVLAESIRARALHGEPLEEAAQALAPGSYKDLGWRPLQDNGLRDEIQRFLSEGAPGSISEVLELPSSFNLYCVRERQEEVVPTFEQVNRELRKRVRGSMLQQLGMDYLVTRIMPRADFAPVELFDEELRRMGYRRAGR